MKIKGLTEKINQTLSDKDNTINYLEKEQQKYQELTKEVNQLLTKYGASNFTQLSNGIKGLLSDRQNFKDERDQARAEITKKDDRIAQLDQFLKGSVLIFGKRQQVINQLKQDLEKEQKNATSPEQTKHLQTDILRLAGERKELTEQIAELKTKEEFLKEFRDKELAELKADKNKIVDNYQKLRTVVADKMFLANGNSSGSVNCTDEEIIKETDKLIEAYQWYYSEMAKERGWWNKWINDERILITSDMDDSQELPTLIANQLGSTTRKSFEIKFEFGYDKLIYLKYSGEIEKGKKIVRKISEYYKEEK